VGDGPTVTGHGVRRVFRIQPGAFATIKQLRIKDGRAPSTSGLRGGGAIRNRGELILLDSTVRDSRAGAGGLGGGILNLGDLTVFDSTIRANRASRGGGIDSRRLDASDPLPDMTIRGTDIVRNRAEDGGGIHNMGSAFMEFSNIGRNRAGFGGGGIANVQTGSFDIENTTIGDNVAGTEGGGIATYDGAALTLSSVSFSANVPDDCIGSPAC
jgi:fibronectin-binding autotransporter adhesin